jgi:hypothetical protein
MRLTTFAAAACLALVPMLAPCMASAQQEGPSLAVTLDFVRGKLNAQGMITYAGAVTDSTNGNSWSNQWSESSTSAPETAACVFHYHWKQIRDGQTQYDGDYASTLSAVTDVRLLPKAAVQQKIDADAGHPSYSFQMNPPVWEVQLIQGAGGYAHFAFTDQDIAERVAKAMAHAALLCGGLKPEPF